MRYIYLIQSLENSHYKIGISNNPQRRIKELQTGNSSQLRLVEVYQSEYAEKIERALQKASGSTCPLVTRLRSLLNVKKLKKH
jgi:predicted GIY-YIG superfamily endonuclease